MESRADAVAAIPRLRLAAYFFAAVLSCGVESALADGGKLTQCWIDNRGQRACGDSIPSEYVKKERQLYDARGATSKIMPAEKTAAEHERERRAGEDAERLAAYDRYLLQTYQSVKQIETSRDERLAIVDNRLLMAEKTLQDSSATLEDLRSRNQAKAGQETDPELQRQIRDFKAARESNADAVARIRDERAKLNEQFTHDINRYSTLRNVTAQSAPLLQR